MLSFTTWARFPLFSQGIKFNIPRSLIITGEGGAETIADNNSKTIQLIYFPQGNNLDQHSPPKKKKTERYSTFPVKQHESKF